MPYGDPDPSGHCAVLVGDDALWREVLSRGPAIASLPDGRSLVPQRLVAHEPDDLRAPGALEALEQAPVLVADLGDLTPEAFGLVSWLARARPRSVILLRRQGVTLPFEVHDLLVHPYDPRSADGRARARVALAELCLAGAYARDRDEAGPGLLTTPAGNRAARRRRERNGVLAALGAAHGALLEGDAAQAAADLALAVAREPDAPDLLLRLALLHRRLGRFADARLALERARRLDPRPGAIWRELGLAADNEGRPEAESLLRHAAERCHDFEALVALAHWLGRAGRAEEGSRLLERALRQGGGALGLVLPALILRTASEGRVRLIPGERERVQEVLALRRAQAEAEPPQDAPWSHFDAARALLLLGDPPAALALCERAAPHLSAPWQAETFGRSLDALEGAGVPVGPLRAALGLSGRASARPPAERGPTPPFRAAPVGPAEYLKNIPCLGACPVGTDAGAYVHLLAQGRFEEAFLVARGPNPFASVCGRICAAPCEDACRRGHLDAPVQIRNLKRFLTERHGVEGVNPRVDPALAGVRAPGIEGEAYASHLKALAAPRPHKVAVVGGGPAGLACAHDLAILGHAVTVFEATHALGGMMRQGIPIYRLSRDLLELEIGAILSLGVEVRLGEGLDARRSLSTLFEEGFEAVFLASGAGRGRLLEVEGAHLDGVVRAIDYLLNANQGYRMDIGESVVVVGGGNVALDVARTARLGHAPGATAPGAAREAERRAFGALGGGALRRAVRGRPRQVHVIARQPMGEWPAQRTTHGGEELAMAREEGIVFHPLRGVRRILGANGRVRAVELAEVVELKDESGRYAPRYGAHAAEVIPCETVFLAVGQEPDLEYLGAARGLIQTQYGLIQVDRETLATSLPGVYAGGDAAFGPRTLIEAVSDGKRAARHLHAHLTGRRASPLAFRFEERHPRDLGTAPGYDARPRRAPPSTDVSRRTGISEIEQAFTASEAVEQAGRCLVCHVQTVYRGERCIACGRCTEICPHACLTFVEPDAVDLAGAARGTALAPGQVWLLKDEDRCVRCGLCAERCPTGAMTMERFHAAVPEEVPA